MRNAVSDTQTGLMSKRDEKCTQTKGLPRYKWAECVGVALVISLFGTIALFAVDGWSYFERVMTGSLPNWLQGIGTVGAIFAAIRVGERQANENRKLQKMLTDEAMAKSLGAISALFDIAFTEFQIAVDGISTDPQFWFDNYYQNNFYAALNRQIDQISVHSLPTYESVRAVVNQGHCSLRKLESTGGSR